MDKFLKLSLLLFYLIVFFPFCLGKLPPFNPFMLLDINSENSSSSRFTSALGILDTTFGTGGYVIQDIASGNDYGRSLAIQSDGKILLGGNCYDGSIKLCIARFNSNGSLDSSFGTGGYVIQDIASGGDFGLSLAIQSDGKILLGGNCYDASYQFCIARFNSNGSLDSSFGTGGYVIQDIASGDDYGLSLAIQSDGKILLGGYCYDASDKFCIARFR